MPYEAEFIRVENAALHQENERLHKRILELEGMLAEARRIEVALSHSQILLQLIIDTLPGAVFWKDTNLIYQGCNNTFATIAGVGKPTRIVGKSDYDLPWTREQADFFRDTDRRLMDEDKAVYHIIEPQLQADGKQAWLDTNKIPLHDAEGTVIGILGTFEDITERKQLEEERVVLQQQVIDAQQAALRELSTPLIPLSDDVVLMPLIGAIDTQRAQHIMEVLLEGIADYQADTAILDITGVSVVDTQVANALIQAAQAARLLGAQVVLTGIGPMMAQTLVHLGADLSTIQTRSNLQRAVLEALAK